MAISGLHEDFNGGKDIYKCTVNSRVKFVFRFPTCSHSTFCTISAFEKKVLAGNQCKLCGKFARSKGELRLRQAVEEVFVGHTFTVEDRVVQSFKGAVDLFIPAYSLIVQFDGPHHFEGKYHNTTAASQKVIDKRLNCKAFGLGFRVFRVHHLDGDELKKMIELLKRVKHNCDKFSAFRFVWESRSFKTPVHLGRGLVQV